MKLMTAKQREQLLANGAKTAAGHPGDHKPVIKLFNPTGAQTWLISELDPECPDIAFGLADLGFGTPEMGSVSISELESFKGPLGLGIERDIHFEATKTLSEYADEARATGRIAA